MLKLVNALMDSVRIGSGCAQITFRPTDLAVLTKDLASQFESVISSAGLRFKIDRCSVPELAYVDREVWEKIVLNFLSNALKFTFSGEIKVSLRMVGNQFELTVRDTGVGIAPDALPHIFDRFYRVPEAQGRTVEGTGIGLALVKELVQMHGGSVSAESEPGRGSVFRVLIPRGSAHIPQERIRHDSREFSFNGPSPLVDEALGWLAANPPVARPQRQVQQVKKPADSPNPERARVVVAEDNTDMRQFLVELLAEQYEVEGVADGVEALAAVQASPPELVGSDIMMPRLDGIRLLRALRADPATNAIPILLISARAGEDATMEALTVGADDYLCKPFSSREAAARIANLVTIKRSRELLQNALASRERDLETLTRALIQREAGLERAFREAGS
jgi:CheY-like chemotaxis protein/anti-sigma regulatory factor (Ser/Thr protein kinase)